jgi:tRNA pseudouridine32 synthase / 23S rRNA pseudouridine746 synthase
MTDSTITYLYRSLCPESGELLQLPRTLEVEVMSRELMLELARDERYDREGKMYGVLLVATPMGERVMLKAFSGLLNGVAAIDGWVPPLPGRELVVGAEAQTLEDLAAMKQELITLAQLPEREEYRGLAAEFGLKLEQQAIAHRHRKELRQQTRSQLFATLTDPELTIALEQLERNSRQDGRERRQLKNNRDTVLQPLRELVARADERRRELRQARKMRSRQLQAQMHDAYQLMNFLGTSSSLRELMPTGMPTGTGDCCAPKLLHYAASHQFKPIAMAEFWWGADSGDKVRGEFYGACQERCQPLMGFMLAGLERARRGDSVIRRGGFSLPMIYEDEYLMAIDKPTGLLSVPGRYLDTQDSVLTRLRQYLPDREEIYPVHRLDRDTSGILLLARDRATHLHLIQQFKQRQTRKVYEAILGGVLECNSGTIDLPLSGNPHDRPRQIVDLEHGKASLTKFQVLARMNAHTRVELIPINGRTHQLRVHSADPHGLGIPILGDRLYGCQVNAERLHLHARELSFSHPTLEEMKLVSNPPF